MNRSAMNMSALAGGLLLAGSMMAGVAAAAPADLNSVTVRPAPTHAAVPLAENGTPRATICIMAV